MTGVKSERRASKTTKNYCHHWTQTFAEYKLSSKLKHLPFFVQICGLKDDRCQHWQVSRITENYCHQWIQHLQIVHYAKFRGKWLTSLPVPRSPFPAPLFKDSRFKLQQKVLKFNDICVSWSSPKTDLVTNFLNLENRSFENVSFK